MEYKHKPVLLKEVLELMPSKEGGVYVDGTLGGGGHARALLEKLGAQNPKSKIKLIGIDQDLEAIFAAKKNLKEFEDQIEFVHDNYSNLSKILDSKNIQKVDAILLDLGVSSYQLDNITRGFSFKDDAPLDMRMNKDQEFTAHDIVNLYDEDKLADVMYKFGEERYSRQIARKIVDARNKKKIDTTSELVEVIKTATPPKYRFGSKIHFATRVFQALRIETNDELDVLAKFIPEVCDLLNPGGRLMIISFHSLEDRIVKHLFRDIENICNGKFKVLTKKPIVATEEEIAENPRSRSAKMRVLEKQI